jgi:hypothetical protein
MNIMFGDSTVQLDNVTWWHGLKAPNANNPASTTLPETPIDKPKDSPTQTNSTSSSLTVSNFTASAAAFQTQNNNNASRVAILMFGQSARGESGKLCSPWSMNNQIFLAHNFVQVLTRLQANLTFPLDLFLSTNECGHNENNYENGTQWKDRLVSMYEGWLKPTRLKLDSCLSPPSTHCNFLHVLNLFVSHGGQNVYSAVMMARPDVFINPDGELLLSDLVQQSLTRFVWPHMCEHSAWAQFQCVSDLFFGMPSRYLQGFSHACMGRVGCYPMAYQDKSGWGHVSKPFGVVFDIKSLEGEGGKGVARSGHACFRCLANLQKQNGLNFWQPPTTSRWAGKKFSIFQSLQCHSEQQIRNPDSCAKTCTEFPNRRCRAWTVNKPESPCACELYNFAVELTTVANLNTVRELFHSRLYKIKILNLA